MERAKSGRPDAHRIDAVTAFLLDREPLLPALASRLGRDAVFESAIRGSSMSPAIPTRARLRVRLRAGQSCRAGDIVYYLADRGFMVHRVAHVPLRGPAADCLITFGDNCLAPDPPASKDRVLGVVVAVRALEGWREPGPASARTVYHRIVRGVALRATVAVARFSLPASRRMAILLQGVESALRNPGGRVLRRLRLISSVRRGE